MSDSDEFEYESDDDPYGGQEEEVSHRLDALHLCLCKHQDGDEEAIQIENTFYEAASQSAGTGAWSLYARQGG